MNHIQPLSEGSCCIAVSVACPEGPRVLSVSFSGLLGRLLLSAVPQLLMEADLSCNALLQLPPRHKQRHVNIMVVGAAGLGKTTFVQ